MSLTPTKEHGGVEKAEKQRSIFIRLAPFLIVCGFGSLIMIPIYRKYGIKPCATSIAATAIDRFIGGCC